MSYAIKNTLTNKWYIGTQLYNVNKNGHLRQFCDDDCAKLFKTKTSAELEIVVRQMPKHYKVIKVEIKKVEE